MGTLKYMSPEQWGIGIEIDHLTRHLGVRRPAAPHDLRPPSAAPARRQPARRHRDARAADAVDGGGRAAGLPRELIQIVDRCLLKMKEQRWQQRAELLRALEPFLPGRRTARAADRREPVRRSVVVPGGRRRQVLRPQPRDRGDGHADPRPAADGGRRQLGRRQVVVRARRSRARAQALAARRGRRSSSVPAASRWRRSRR